jgi:hypothetical protein
MLKDWKECSYANDKHAEVQVGSILSDRHNGSCGMDEQAVVQVESTRGDNQEGSCRTDEQAEGQVGTLTSYTCSPPFSPFFIGEETIGYMGYNSTEHRGQKLEQ